MKETFVSLSERTFILEALKKENRIDGRRVQDIRTVKIAFREQYGSAEVQYGKTRYNLNKHEEIRSKTNHPTNINSLHNLVITSVATTNIDTNLQYGNDTANKTNQ